MTPEQYTVCYDAIVSGIKAVAPNMKFVGLALALPSHNPQMFEYFLNPAHHKPGIPLDMISYHFYAVPEADQTPEVQQFTFFTQADQFIFGPSDTSRRSANGTFSHNACTTVDEIGVPSRRRMGRRANRAMSSRPFQIPTGRYRARPTPMFLANSPPWASM